MAAEKKRYVEYDIMRILACFGVIMIHVGVFSQADQYSHATLAGQAFTLWGMLSRWAVPAFVMLSGMMILPKAEETTIPKLLLKRVLRMLLAYIAWSCVYSAYNVFVLGDVYSTSVFKTFIDGCFSGETHMWYLPMLAGLYLASPILALLIKKLDHKWTVYWLVGMFVFSSLIPFVEKLNVKFLSVVIGSINGYMDLQFFGGWTLYFVLGYYIRQHSFTKKEKWTIYIAAIAAFLFTFERTVLYALRNGQSFGVLPYEYPNIVLYSVGVMVFFKEEVSRISLGERAKKWISGISALTFGIYLSHIFLLKVLYSVGIQVQSFHPMLSIPAVSALVFVIGAGLTWLIHRIPVLGKYIA